LTARQRNALHLTLCNTLQLYVSSATKLHPGVLATAIRLAVNECSVDRQTRAKSLFHIMCEPNKSRWSKWVGEFHEAMENARGDPSQGGKLLEKANSDRDEEHEGKPSRRRQAMLWMRSKSGLGVGMGLTKKNTYPTERTAVHNLGFHTATPDELQVCLQRRAAEIVGKSGRFWEVHCPEVEEPIDDYATIDPLVMLQEDTDSDEDQPPTLEKICSDLAKEEVALMREAERLRQELKMLEKAGETEMDVVPQALEEIEALDLRRDSSLILPTLRLGLSARPSAASSASDLSKG